MDRVCPRCRGTTPEQLCPRCGIRTADRAAEEPLAVAAKSDSVVRPASDDILPAANWFVGLLLAQGLYYALRHLASAWLLARGGAAAEAEFWEDRFAGLIALQALQTAALFAGGMLAAAGQRRGLVIGAALGLVNALLLIGLQLILRRPVDELTWYVTPLLHTFVGAVAGAVGSRVWQPAPELPPLVGDGRVGSSILTIVLPERSEVVLADPVPWLRILAGIAVAVAGTLGASLIQEFVEVAGGGTGRRMQSQFITWEIAIVAQVIGGVLAGSGMRAGLKFGFWVGLPAAIILVVAQASGGVRAAAPSLPSRESGAMVPAGSPEALVILGCQALLLCGLGGWLGSLILPADPRRKPAAER